MKTLTYLLLIALMAGCASTHPGTQAVARNAGNGLNLKISADHIKDYSDNYNYFIDVTFENMSGNWARIDEVELDFSNSQNLAHNVIVGQDLFAWAESFEERKKIEDHNTSLAINSIILAGAVASAASGSKSDVKIAGTAAVFAGTAWDATRQTLKAKNAAERSKSVPEKHIYRPFTVPAGGLIRRWFIVSVPGSMVVRSYTLKIKTVDGLTAEYEIPM